MESLNKACPFCGEPIKADAIKCKHCNEWLDKSNIKDDEILRNKKYSGKVSTTKFIVLSLATFGTYPYYWMYDQWQFLKHTQNFNISPLWRTLFSVFYAGYLATDIKRFLKKKRIIVGYSPAVVGVSFFALSFLYKLPDPFWLIVFLPFMAILPLLESMNEYYEEYESELKERELSWWKVMLTGIGLMLFYGFCLRRIFF